MRASEEGRFTNYSEELQFCVYENIYSRPLPFLTGSQIISTKVALVECVIIFKMGRRSHCWKAVDGAPVFSFTGDCLFFICFFGCLIIIWWSPVGLFLIHPSFYKEISRSFVWFGSWYKIGGCKTACRWNVIAGKFSTFWSTNWTNTRKKSRISV